MLSFHIDTLLSEKLNLVVPAVLKQTVSENVNLVLEVTEVII